MNRYRSSEGEARRPIPKSPRGTPRKRMTSEREGFEKYKQEHTRQLKDFLKEIMGIMQKGQIIYQGYMEALEHPPDDEKTAMIEKSLAGNTAFALVTLQSLIEDIGNFRTDRELFIRKYAQEFDRTVLEPIKKNVIELKKSQDMAEIWSVFCRVQGGLETFFHSHWEIKP